jgi:hypothetical protein
MDEASSKAGALEGEVKDLFADLFGEALEKYSVIRARYNTPETETDLKALGWEDEFLELKEALDTVDIAYQFINSGYAVYGMYFSAYERAEKLAQYIINNAPPQVVDAYYHELLYKFENAPLSPEEGTDTGESSQTEWTMEYAMSIYRSLYITMQINLNGSCIYDVYNDVNMAEFYDKYFDMVWSYLLSGDEDENVFDREKCIECIKAFEKLDLAGQLIFVMSEGEIVVSDEPTTPYYLALDAFIAEEFTGAAANLLYKLIELEEYYLYFFTMLDEESYNSLVTLLAEVEELKEALATNPADVESFEGLEDYCDSVIKKVSDLIEELENEPLE